jgi:hypothetical protein
MPKEPEGNLLSINRPLKHSHGIIHDLRAPSQQTLRVDAGAVCPREEFVVQQACARSLDQREPRHFSDQVTS